MRLNRRSGIVPGTPQKIKINTFWRKNNTFAVQSEEETNDPSGTTQNQFKESHHGLTHKIEVRRTPVSVLNCLAIFTQSLCKK